MKRPWRSMLIVAHKDGITAGAIIVEKGKVSMSGLCGDRIEDGRPVAEIVAALAAEGCVMKVIKPLKERQAA